MKLKIILANIFGLISSLIIGQNHCAIKIYVKDKETSNPITDSVIVFLNENQSVYRLKLDSDGYIIIKELSPNKYNVKVMVIGYQATQINGVIVGEGKTAYLTYGLSKGNLKIRKRNKRHK